MSKRDYRKEHRDNVWKVIEPLIDAEPIDKPIPDSTLCEAAMSVGLWATENLIRSVREWHKVPCSEERRIIAFAKKFKASKKAK